MDDYLYDRLSYFLKKSCSKTYTRYKAHLKYFASLSLLNNMTNTAGKRVRASSPQSPTSSALPMDIDETHVQKRLRLDVAETEESSSSTQEEVENLGQSFREINFQPGQSTEGTYRRYSVIIISDS